MSDEQQRQSEDAGAVDAHQGENNAAGAVVDEFQFSGRYAVDLDLVSKSLQKNLLVDKDALQRASLLKMCTKSVKFGLANFLYIICSACGLENQCPTSSRLYS